MRATRVRLAAATAGLLLAACGPDSQLRLSMRAVDVTVPRIVAPAVDLVPVSGPPLMSLPPVPAVVDQLPPTVPSDPVPPQEACPQAPPTAVPKAAAVTLEASPANQTLLQRSSGGYTVGATRGTLGDPVQVTITNLPATATASGQMVLPWRVQEVDTATNARAVEVYQLLLPSSAPGALAPGVYLVGLAWDDPVRGALTFQPAGNGLFVLPSPVSVAQNDTQYVGIATDPNTLTTLELTRNVRAKKRVDICGDLVDTWTVEMAGSLVTPSAQWNLAWTKQVATAYGAVDVDRSLSLEARSGGRSWARRLVSTRVPVEPR